MAGIEKLSDVAIDGAKAAINGFLVLAGIALAAVVAKYGATVVIGVINQGVDVIKRIIA